MQVGLFPNSMMLTTVLSEISLGLYLDCCNHISLQLGLRNGSRVSLLHHTCLWSHLHSRVASQTLLGLTSVLSLGIQLPAMP